ncbi:MAG: EAL domain-containing protein, partial [Campylobacterota bacterium]
IRWESSKLGFITPDEFIPLAEDSGNIIKIGAWVIEQACKDFSSWQKLGLNIKELSVNVSNVQFANADVVKVLSDSIAAYDIPSGALEVEITESYMQKDSEQALKTLHDIRDLGVNLAIDDFGTGYSSMSYLKKLPITRLKIDRSFIGDIPQDNDDIEITKIIVSLAKIMGLETTAEGVETLEQLHFLQELGVDEGQEYICSKPLPGEQFIEYLKKKPNCIV